MRTIKTPRLVLAIVAFSVVAVIALYLSIFSTVGEPTKQSLQSQQTDLVAYAADNRLTNKDQIYHGSSTLCSRSSEGSRQDCTLSSTYVYKLNGNYRDNGKEIFAYLKQRGFDFKSSSKYKDSVPKKLNDTSIKDNLSNSTPIIVDVYNKKTQTRVRVTLGDFGRTSFSYSPKSGQAMDNLGGDQLIAALQFYRP
ncbi:hypothetical protein BH09PAT3_BH09PAT3_0880 [soil metagenome]